MSLILLYNCYTTNCKKEKKKVMSLVLLYTPNCVEKFLILTREKLKGEDNKKSQKRKRKKVIVKRGEQ